jgi:hypothetical protein
VCVCDGVLHWPQNNKRMIGVNGSQIIQPSSPLGGGEVAGYIGNKRKKQFKESRGGVQARSSLYFRKFT